MLGHCCFQLYDFFLSSIIHFIYIFYLEALTRAMLYTTSLSKHPWFMLILL